VFNPAQPKPRNALASIAAPATGMNQRTSAADSNSKPQVGILGSDRRSAQPPMSGRNTTLITAKQASTTPTLNGVPPSKVM
jgi:hypothetical protein